MSKRSNKPIWLILTLVVIGVLAVTISQVIAIDSNTDEVSHEARN